jgi:hypothetical protein
VRITKDAKFIIAKTARGASLASALFVKISDGKIKLPTKKMPAVCGRAQPKIGPRDAEFGRGVLRAKRNTPAAITHIGCV